MEKIKSMIEGIKNGWNKMDKRKRIIMISLVSSVILFSFFYTYIIKKPNYTTLFTNLDLEDAGKITKDLEDKKIKYRLEDGGTKILIDGKLVDEYRLQLAMEGNMPEKSSGFEIFDSIGLMVTDDDRKIMYQRALTGELQRSIMSLDAVNSAKVHLVMSEKSIFETREKEASASVILDLNPDHRISDSMIKGIAALISGAVDNLPEENIQIIDSRGNLLSRVLNEEDSLNSLDIVTRHQNIREDFEYKMENDLKRLLEDVFGKDRIRVSVSADLDFDAEESVSTVYEDPVIRSMQVSGNGENSGIQFQGGNIGDNPSVIIDDAARDDAGYSITINNELSSETTTKVKAPGKINRLTTSVVYDGTLPEGSPRAEQIRDIVSGAIGYDEERGDVIEVSGILFERSKEDIAESEPSPVGWDKYKKYTIPTVGALLVLAIGIFIMKSQAKKKREEEIIALEEEFERQNEIERASQDIGRLEEKIEVTVDTDEIKAKNYAKDNPDLAADLIKVWLKN